jgi:hypothetical protein
MPTNDLEETKIRSLITELTAATPQAPSMDEIERLLDRIEHGSEVGPDKSGHRLRVLALAGVGCAVALALALALVLPGRNQKYPEAEASQLAEIATNAAAQPQVTLNRGQWVATTAKLSFQASVTRGVDPLANPAQASIDGTIGIWEDGFGQVCTSTTLGTADFPSTGSEDAWNTLGLLDSPANQPVMGCTVNSGGSLLDDSQFSTDPTVLAQQIEALSSPVQLGARKNIAEVANILMGPAIGSSPALVSAVYGALSILPDIHALGMVTTHSGASGLGYMTPSSSGATTIIVDPSTGALLEVQNLPFITALANFVQSLAASYMDPNSDLISQMPSLSSNISWLDPTSTFQIVDASALPSGLSPAPEPIATLIVTTKAGVSDDNMVQLLNRIADQVGGGVAETGYGRGADGDTYDYKFTGSESALSTVVAQFRDSALIASVTVNMGQS